MFDVMNPRTLKAKSDLHPGETFETVQIPLGPLSTSPFPFSILIEYWIRDQQSGRQSLVIQQPPTEIEVTFMFLPGETTLKPRADGGFEAVSLVWPNDGVISGLLSQIAAHQNPAEFGLVDLGSDPAAPACGLYRPHLSQSGGETKRMARESLTRALTQLVDLGWLENPETIGKTDRYALTDAAKVSDSFIQRVAHYKSLRERGS